MLKIFLVEDEFVVREGIKNNIDWEAHGYEFCGEAGDGEMAFPMIQKLKPDIVITDIRMPFMDGLSLSRLIKKEFPWMEIILLTGYEKFEYAKEGIKIGIAQYLSKPINREELLKEIDTLAVKIEEKRKEREMQEKYRREMEESFLNDRKEFFRYLVTGTKTVPELLEMAGSLELDISALWYNIVLIKVQSMDHTQEEYSKGAIKIEQELKKLDNEDHLLVFDRNLEGKAFLFKADTKEELLQVQDTYIGHIQKILTDYEKVRYFGGIGMPVNRLRELPSSFESASHAFAHRYLVKESRILNCTELKGAGYLENEDFNISSINTKQIDRSRIKEFLRFGDATETVYFVEEYLGDNAMKSNLLRQYIAMDVYFCVVEFLEGLQLSKEELGAFDVTPDILQSEENTVAYIVSIIKKALELREKKASNRYGNVVAQIKEYIEKNYSDEELSLNLLASHVNFSPNHLSTIFSQQTGNTFSRYLTDYRMNKAKELLRCTGKKASVISTEIGYKDPHYFSYLFKKTQGMTPTQYRNGKETKGEE